MSQVILLCGKVCAGKSFYAEKLKKERNIVVLSVDELMLSLFPEHLGDRHCETVRKSKEFLSLQAEKIAAAGCDVLLEYGLWGKAERDELRERFESLGHEVQLVYIKASDEKILENAKKRNADRASGNEKFSYEADEALLGKCSKMFCEPSEDECDEIIDVG